MRELTNVLTGLVAAAIMLACGGEANLFDPESKPPAGKEITITGTIDYNTTYARLKVEGGEFGILLDETGEKMASELDGQRVEVNGVLTGKATYDMISALSTPTSGTVSGTIQVPELRVIDFKISS